MVHFQGHLLSQTSIITRVGNLTCYQIRYPKSQMYD